MRLLFQGLTGLFATIWVCVALAQGDAAEAERDLNDVLEKIGDLEKGVKQQAKQRSATEQSLQQAEIAESRARRKLKDLARQLTDTQDRLVALNGQVESTKIKLSNHRSELSRQLRLAYITGQEEWLRLVLSQQDPTAVGRQLVYHSYITRRRAGVVADIRIALGELEEATSALHQEQQRLQQLEVNEQQRLEELSAARQNRSLALAKIETGIASQTDEIDRLRRQATELESVLKELTRLLSQLPIGDASPFAERKGQMDWPTDGRLVWKFGQPKADGQLRWDGVLLATSAGSDVRAIHHGRVVFADWLPGMGLLLVVEHGDGYLSLYGHNQDLLKDVGEWVTPGTVIAHVGDSGGQLTSGLYFEIRKDGKPVDPGQWIGH